MEHIFTQNLDIPNVLKDKATSILATHCPDEYFNDLLYVRVLGCSTGGWCMECGECPAWADGKSFLHWWNYRECFIAGGFVFLGLVGSVIQW